MGASVSIEDEEAFYHLWRVAGALLGIREDALPESAPEARALADRIADRQLAPSPEGRALAADLVAAMERHMRAPLLRPVPRALMHHLLGDRVCGLLGIEKRLDVPAGLRQLAAMPGVGWLSRNAPAALVKLGPVAGRRLLEAMMAVQLKGKEPTFRMPGALGERWDLTSV
jgi:ER-bound oxygenase mpaB/B'/Rubber oxygenase, catalytic domain